MSETHAKKAVYPCEWNDGVACQEKDCENCGWHPKAIKERMAQLKKAGKVTVKRKETEDEYME